MSTILCACGCLQQTSIHRDKKIPNKFIRGHNGKGKNHYNWKGGKTLHTNGYLLVIRPNHPQSDCKGRMYEHRLIMEQYLGRYLTKDEDVHHINGIKTDNRIENLELLTKEHHTKLHFKGKEIADMSNRVCQICSSESTIIQKRNGRPNWFKHDNGFICNKCYMKLSYRRKHTSLGHEMEVQ